MNLTKSTKFYIAGCGGMLGDAVYQACSEIGRVKATDIDVNEPWLESGDVRDHAAIEKSVREFKPDVLINLAALTDLELCERESDNAWKTNAYGAENLGRIASELDVPFIHVSTAGVFDGSKDIFTDEDPPVPLSVYAKTKFHAEQYLESNVPKRYVLRAGWMMGGGPRKDKKFINKIYRQIAAGQKELHVVDDKLGTPTYTVDFARGMLHLLQQEAPYDLYNQVCGGGGSRYDVAVEFVHLLGLEGKVRVKKVDSAFFQKDFFAPRPPSEKLVNQRLERLRLNVMRDWRVCLAEYAETFKADLDSRGPSRAN